MKVYIGTKIVKAEPMTGAKFAATVRPLPGGAMSKDGYKVVYDDGYVSWSPKEQFRRAYRELTIEEEMLVEGTR